MNRPDTAAGSVAKRRELAALHASFEAELRKVGCDLDHLDAAIRLFDLGATPSAVRRYTTWHHARSLYLLPMQRIWWRS